MTYGRSLVDEEGVLAAVNAGILRVDRDGSIWRCKKRQVGDWGSRWFDVDPVRCEHDTGSTLQVRVTAGHANRIQMQVDRLVWRVYRGPIPPGKKIAHRDDDRYNNALDNLTLVDLCVDLSTAAPRRSRRGKPGLPGSPRRAR